MSARIGAAGAALLAWGVSTAAAAPASPAGRWLTEDGAAVIEIAPCGPALCGAIHKVLNADPKAPKTDVHNPDPRLRQRPTANLRILSGFVPDGSRWKGHIDVLPVLLPLRRRVLGVHA
jgi:uncharacterized protein (DUF2147 family)